MVALTPYALLPQLLDTLDKQSAEDTDILDRCLLAATASINLFTGRRFDQVTATRTFDGSGGSRLMVGDFVSVSAINYTYPGATPQVIDPTTYYLGPSTPNLNWPYQWIDQAVIYGNPFDVVTGARWFPLGTRTVSVTGVWGWPAVPDDIVMTCISIAARLWKASKAGFNDIIGTDATGELTFSKSLTSLDKMVLGNYKRRFIV